MTKNDEKTTTTFAKDVELVIRKIDLKMSKFQPETIEQVRFLAESGDVTFKPKVKNEIAFKGLTKVIDEPMLANDFADYPKTVEIVNEINKRGSAKLKVSYSIMTKTNDDGTETQYRFISYLSQYDNFEIVQ